MSTEQSEIYNWLITGIQQPSDRIQEIFYFDRKEKEFFSLLVTDYFLFDDDFDISNDVTSTYSQQTLKNFQRN